MRTKIIAVDPILDDYFFSKVTSLIGIHAEVTEEDNTEIAYRIDRGIEALLDFTNRKTVPPQLRNSLIEYIVYDYLFFREELDGLKAAKKEAEEGTTSPNIKQISEGDTTIQFGGGPDVQGERLNYFKSKKAVAQSEWLSYRKIKWI